MSNDKPPANRFSSLDTATNAMDAFDEPVVATTQLLFMEGDKLVPAHQRGAPEPAAAPPAAAQDPVAFLEELLARIAANRRPA